MTIFGPNWISDKVRFDAKNKDQFDPRAAPDARPRRAGRAPSPARARPPGRDPERATPARGAAAVDAGAGHRAGALARGRGRGVRAADRGGLPREPARRKDPGGEASRGGPLGFRRQASPRTQSNRRRNPARRTAVPRARRHRCRRRAAGRGCRAPVLRVESGAPRFQLRAPGRQRVPAGSLAAVAQARAERGAGGALQLHRRPRGDRASGGAGELPQPSPRDRVPRPVASSSPTGSRRASGSCCR